MKNVLIKRCMNIGIINSGHNTDASEKKEC